ncbi:hypothetical protein [Flavobacterium sp. 3HN19-14]|uniref:hypothetical protein n=1 Tax=Flavobacterium sp. 3HN19-14 TaxID=3448133 RepID=UPI003EE30B7E
MEPNKFEKNIKQQLEQRTIEPSPIAWDRLDAMLTVAEEKKAKRGYGWLYIAASFLGFILIGTIFFSQTEEVIDKSNGIVIEDKAPLNTSVETIEMPENVNPKSENTNIAVTEKESIKIIKNHHYQSKSVIKEALPVIENNQNQIAQNQSSVSINNQKTEQNGNIKTNSNNADELIAAVEKKETAKSRPTVKVDANYLLSEVDGDQPDLSFTERVLVKANKNYKSIKTAIANRNKE